jgi:lipopolysaccharide transport system permease protein
MIPAPYIGDKVRAREALQGRSVSNSCNNVSYAKHIVITSRAGLARGRIAELWRYRELLYFFIWRDLKVRYKQTALGLLWAVLRPAASMGIFTFVFSTVGSFPASGIPYPLLTLSGIVVWTMISEGIYGATHSMTSNPHLITKVYFPRLLLPIASVLRTLVDTGVTLALYALVALWYRHPFTLAIAWLPLALFFAIASALGFGFWSSALSVRYRDIGLALPLLIQMLFWISPIGYLSTNVPGHLQVVYWINPVVGVIEAFRSALLGASTAPFPLMALSVCINAVFLLSGAWYFFRAEDDFADMI